jgi:hypothetical protein
MESPSAKTFRFHHPPPEAIWEASLARPPWKSLSTNLASEAGWMKGSKSSAKRLRFATLRSVTPGTSPLLSSKCQIKS